MKKEDEIYSEWIRHRQSMQVPEDFAERLMGEIARRSALNDPPAELPDVPRALCAESALTEAGIWASLYRFLHSHPVQWAAAAGALIVGLFRLSYITTTLLLP